MSPPIFRRIAAWPWSLRILLLACAYTVFWATALGWNHRAPTLDSAEQLVWSYSMELGYWKHPPMPSWIIHGLVQVFGPSVALPIVAAQASIAIALALTWRLGCEFMTPSRSLVAAALSALVGYHGWFMQDYNHNSALLPFQAASVLAFWMALRGRSWRWWAVAGLCTGLALMTKYVMVFPLAAIGIYLLLRRELHTRRTVLGAGLAAVVALCVCAPHIVWLTQHDFQPVRYASRTAVHAADALAWGRNIENFLGNQLAQIGVFLIVLALAVRPLPKEAHEAAPPERTGDRLFLWVVGVAPLVLLLAYSAITATELESRWGSNLFLLVGWLAMDLLRPDAERDARLLRAGAWGLAVSCAMVAIVVPAAQFALRAQGRAQFPGAQLWHLARDTWVARTGQPLRLVVGETWLAGALAAEAGRSIAVLADGEYLRAPWVSPADVERCGAIVLQDRSVPREERRVRLTQLMASAPLHGEWLLPWWPDRTPYGGDDAGRRIAWAILPPRPGTTCPL